MSQKTRKKKKGQGVLPVVRPESGHSMVEILGVLGIIGVIISGGIWGTRYAFDYMKANAIRSGIRERLSALDRRNIQRSVKKTKQILQGFKNGSNEDLIYDIYPTELEERDDGAPVLKVSGISQNVCQILKQWSETSMTINDPCLIENNVARFDLTFLNHINN